MSIYIFKKWFFDTLLNDSKYLFFYVSYIRFFNCKITSIDIITANKDEKPEHLSHILPARFFTNDKNNFSLKTKEINIHFVNNKLELKYFYKNLNITLNFSGTFGYHFKAEPIVKIFTNSNINWYPLTSYFDVSGSLETKGKKIIIQNQKGYGDYVESTIIPFMVPIKELFWGRILTDNIEFTFSIVKDSKNIYRSRIFMWIDSKMYYLTESTIYTDCYCYSSLLKISYPEKVVITAKNEQIELTLNITKIWTAIESNFFDSDNSYGKIINNLLWNISRRPRGLKIVADFKMSLREEGREIYKIEQQKGVYEIVKFI